MSTSHGDEASGHPIYDRIFRENIAPVMLSLLRHLRGLEILDTEDLPEVLVQTIERRPDFVKKVLRQRPYADFPSDPYILHLEVQTHDDPEMLYRMQEYHALLSRRYRMEVRQYVIYLGKKPSRMQTTLAYGGLRYQYELLSVSGISYQAFLKGSTAEEALMAILGDFGAEAAEVVTHKIIERIIELSPETLSRIKYVKQLEILSKLRSLQSLIIEQLTDMAFRYDLEDDVRYRQGIQQGVQQGIQQGHSEGITIQQRKTIEKMIQKGCPDALICEYTDASPELVASVRGELGHQNDLGDGIQV